MSTLYLANELSGLLLSLLIYLSDPTLTIDSVAESMELISNWSLLRGTIFKCVIPHDKLYEIQRRCSTKRDIAHKLASYYIHCHPNSSWTHLAGCLYGRQEFAVVEKLQPFLPLRGNYIMRIDMIITIILGWCKALRVQVFSHSIDSTGEGLNFSSTIVKLPLRQVQLHWL